MWLAGVTPTVLGGLAKSTEHGFSVELDGRPLLSHRFKGKFVTAAALPGDGRAHRHFADVLDRGR
jgi:hypothetical protein